MVGGAEIALGTSVVLSSAFCKALDQQPMCEDTSAAASASAAEHDETKAPVVFCGSDETKGLDTLMGRRGVVVDLVAWDGHDDKGVLVKWHGIPDTKQYAYGRGMYQVRPLYALDVLQRHSRSTLVPGNVATVRLTKMTLEKVMDKVEKALQSPEEVC